MRSKTGATLLIIAVGCILQLAIAPNIAIFGVSPNFLLLVIIAAGLIDGPVTGLIVGFALGLLFDLIGTGPLAPMAFVGTLVGYVAGLLQSNITARDWVLPLTIFAVCAFLADVAYAIILEIISTEFSFWSNVLYTVVPATIYNTAIALAIFPVVNRLLQPKQTYMTVKRRY